MKNQFFSYDLISKFIFKWKIQIVYFLGDAKLTILNVYHDFFM